MIVRALFVLCLVVAPVVVWTTSAQLPARVASHFGMGGDANGFMSHDGYVLFMLAMTTLLPLAIVASIGFIPRIATSQVSIRYRQHWLAPKHREETLAALATWGCAFGVMMIVFLTGIHFLVLEANARKPAHLDEGTFFALLIGFLVCLALWIGFMAIRFGRPR